jgi:hypothetical protein
VYEYMLMIADAFFELASSGNFGYGNSSNTFSYNDARGNTYSRDVSSANNTITSDRESGNLAQRNQLPVSLENENAVQTGFPRPRLPGHAQPLLDL